jgi:hypothetical protein
VLSPEARSWWRHRRLRYNIGLAVAGLLAFVAYLAAVVLKPKDVDRLRRVTFHRRRSGDAIRPCAKPKQLGAFKKSARNDSEVVCLPNALPRRVTHRNGTISRRLPKAATTPFPLTSAILGLQSRSRAVESERFRLENYFSKQRG